LLSQQLLAEAIAPVHLEHQSTEVADPLLAGPNECLPLPAERTWLGRAALGRGRRLRSGDGRLLGHGDRGLLGGQRRLLGRALDGHWRLAAEARESHGDGGESTALSGE